MLYFYIKHCYISGFNTLIQNLAQLLLEGHNSDAVLNAGQHEFRVHKAILAARSPVFASMFQQTVTQGPIARYDIPDYPHETFKIFLHYLYTGIPDSISIHNVFNLYYAAEMYKINDLKLHCLLYMMDFLSVDNFCDVMVTILRHGEPTLQKVATRFFSQNIQKIIKTVQWEKFSNQYTSEANDLLKKHVLLKNDS